MTSKHFKIDTTLAESGLLGLKGQVLRKSDNFLFGSIYSGARSNTKYKYEFLDKRSSNWHDANSHKEILDYFENEARIGFIPV